MSSKKETNLQRLTRHRADLKRALENRDKLNARIARLEELVAQETNQEYLLILSNASITLDDLRQMTQERTKVNAAKTAAQKKKEEQEHENKT